jgi:HK97 family phage portal protein
VAAVSKKPKKVKATKASAKAAAISDRGKTEPAKPESSRIYFSPRTDAGIYVDADRSLRNATVWACVQYLSRTVAQLPWHVMRDLPGGGSEVAAGHPVDWLLQRRPCPDMGSFSWRQSMLGVALLWGNAYAEIQRDMRGGAYWLWPIHPDRVIVRRAANGELEYEVWNTMGGKATLPAADMFHVRGFGDGPIGYNVIEYAAQSVGWAQATETFGSTYFGEGMNPSGIVETASAMSPAGMELLRAELDKLYKGPKGKRTAILDAGIKFQRLASTPEDSQFIETRQHQVEEICRWFGVPPHKVMHLLRATFSNIEHQSIEVVVDSVTPWVKIFEEEADYKLFGLNRDGLYTKMNLRGLLRGDNVSRLALYKGMFEMGLTMNQILALEDFNGIGPDGDTHFVSNNVQTLERAIAGPQPPADPNSPEDLPALPKKNGATNGVSQH